MQLTSHSQCCRTMILCNSSCVNVAGRRDIRPQAFLNRECRRSIVPDE